MRLFNFLNEKVNKQEINEILKSDDIIVGAEFEFLFDEDFLYDSDQELIDIITRSEEYDINLDDYEKNVEDWEYERNKYYDEIQEENISQEKINELMDGWDYDNPMPIEPEKPNDYIKQYDRPHYHVEHPSGKIIINRSVDDTLRTAEDVIPNYFDEHGIDFSGWDIKEDGSLDDNGVELVSPPMSIGKFLPICEKVFKMIDKFGETTNDCGFHVGVSLKNGMDNIDIVKLILFTDENYIWNLFSEREVNYYVVQMKKLLRKNLMNPNESIYDKVKSENIKEIKKLIDNKKVKYVTSHYHGINIEHLEEDNPYIEFRYMGGEGYHKKFNNVKTVIAQYGYNLKLARDPNFKRKEYLLKIDRVLKQIESYVIYNEINDLRVNHKDEPETKNQIKILQKRLNNLPKMSKEIIDKLF